MQKSTLPLYCKKMAQLIDGVEIDTAEIDFGCVFNDAQDLDFGDKKTTNSHLAGATFKNNDTLSSSKLRELETLLTLPCPDLWKYIEQVNKRYALIADNGMSLNPKEAFFELASRKAIALVLDTGPMVYWASSYPDLTLSNHKSERPYNWKLTRAVFLALVEFMVRELSLSSVVLTWNAPTSNEELS